MKKFVLYLFDFYTCGFSLSSLLTSIPDITSCQDYSCDYFISFWNEINEALLRIFPLLHLIIFRIFIYSLLLSCIKKKKRIIPNASLQVSLLHLSSVSVFCFFLQIVDPSVLPLLQIFLVFFQTKSFPST